jgi:hypothetical protein
MVTGMKMFHRRNPLLREEWSLPRHLRRMFGCGDHSKIKALRMMSLL